MPRPRDFRDQFPSPRIVKIFLSVAVCFSTSPKLISHPMLFCQVSGLLTLLRDLQRNVISQLGDQHPQHLILAGDFNFKASSGGYKRLVEEAGMIAACSSSFVTPPSNSESLVARLSSSPPVRYLDELKPEDEDHSAQQDGDARQSGGGNTAASTGAAADDDVVPTRLLRPAGSAVIFRADSNGQYLRHEEMVPTGPPVVTVTPTDDDAGSGFLWERELVFQSGVNPPRSLVPSAFGRGYPYHPDVHQLFEPCHDERGAAGNKGTVRHDTGSSQELLVHGFYRHGIALESESRSIRRLDLLKEVAPRTAEPGSPAAPTGDDSATNAPSNNIIARSLQPAVRSPETSARFFSALNDVVVEGRGDPGAGQAGRRRFLDEDTLADRVEAAEWENIEELHEDTLPNLVSPDDSIVEDDGGEDDSALDFVFYWSDGSRVGRRALSCVDYRVHREYSQERYADGYPSVTDFEILCPM